MLEKLLYFLILVYFTFFLTPSDRPGKRAGENTVQNNIIIHSLTSVLNCLQRKAESSRLHMHIRFRLVLYEYIVSDIIVVHSV